MEYTFREIERKWQQAWKENKAYEVPNETSKPKFYVLDMFPYPSGAGLHVGHPLGYIASDIYARFKRLKGFNVLHPMGYDAFGLPAEQYALEHGVHPADSTARNIATFRSQMDKIAFSFDWSREVKTSDPAYYKWTQWIFLQLFKSWYNREADKAEPIDTLLEHFSKEGNSRHPLPNAQSVIPGLENNNFTAGDWNGFTEPVRQAILMEYRLAYCGYGEVNWCEALGTVLANDEVINGVSERGGFPVEKKRLRQWYLRITEYADRLLKGLQTVEFSEAMKEMQGNWIGKSSGAEISFAIAGYDAATLDVYTTRPDTIFGVDFMVIAPEHELVGEITTADQKVAVEAYIAYVKSRSERERMAEKKISGVFTGAYAVNPFNQKQIPIWISEYVLAGYGTGAIMAVPSGDERDHKFARHFNLPVTNIIGEAYNGEEANPTKDAKLTNSDFLNGVVMREAIDIVIGKLEEMGIGKRKVNYKIRDAAFSRQRYWGEPFPIKWIDGIAYPLDESELPLELPYVESYKPGPDGEGPLANIPEWTASHLETNTMPGYAGSSWYFLRYMDPHNDQTFCDRKWSDYWRQVDLYVGGTEHAVGHLLYSRMWTKALFDLGYISFDEPFKKLLNQGMIVGVSRFICCDDANHQLLSHDIAYRDANSQEKIEALQRIYTTRRVPSEYVDKLGRFIISKTEDFIKEFKLQGYKFIPNEDGIIELEFAIEKMSKSKRNTINPDDIVFEYGADTFRMYEMFLGPVEMSKPWDTKGIEGVHRFLKKLWRLFFDEAKGKLVTEEKATPDELKILHRTIKKIEEDTERFSFNTSVSAFMVCVNELTDLKCHKRQILEPLLILLTPFAPHISEELWQQLGNSTSILDAAFPAFEASYLVESSKEYPVSVNGKMRTLINLDLNASQDQVQEIVLANDIVQKWMEGKPLKKLIYVKGKMVNVVV
ncbi:MAG TPA: leucine--tRNA ligase [Flavisolibacter sp.]|jgi:leucyl-tRNA synthetase|nr:leucine--tRNA ligase [Flavisolibacter sp.]